MKNHVTYETSLRLKESGFPQPEPEFGQIWWLADFTPLVITFVYSPGQIDFCIEGGPANMGLSLFPNMVFAPTAMDILKVIGGDYGLFSTPHGFEIWRVAYGFREEFIVKNDNPAEAAAQAWLNLKEK